MNTSEVKTFGIKHDTGKLAITANRMAKAAYIRKLISEGVEPEKAEELANDKFKGDFSAYMTGRKVGKGIKKTARAIDTLRNGKKESYPVRFVKALGRGKSVSEYDALKRRAVHIRNARIKRQTRNALIGAGLVAGVAYGGKKLYDRYKEKKNQNKEQNQNQNYSMSMIVFDPELRQFSVVESQESFASTSKQRDAMVRAHQRDKYRYSVFNPDKSDRNYYRLEHEIAKDAGLTKEDYNKLHKKDLKKRAISQTIASGILGAQIGAAIGGRKGSAKGALIGASLGAGAGAVGGNILQRKLANKRLDKLNKQAWETPDPEKVGLKTKLGKKNK